MLILSVEMVNRLCILSGMFYFILGEDFNYASYKTTKKLKYSDNLTTRSTEHKKPSNNLTIKTTKYLVDKTVELNLETTLDRLVDEIWNTTILSNSEYMSENATKNALPGTHNTQQVTLATETQIETTMLLDWNSVTQSPFTKTEPAKDNTEGLRRQYFQYSSVRRQYQSPIDPHSRLLKNYPGVPPPQKNPPTDAEIKELLQEYRGIVNKYRSNNPRKSGNYFEPHRRNGIKTTPLRATGLYPRPRGLSRRIKTWKRNPISSVLKQHLRRPLPDYQSAEYPYFRQGENETTTMSMTMSENETEIDPNATTVTTTTQSTSSTTTKKSTEKRTAPKRVTFDEDCDYIAYYCLKAYDTGPLCGRTVAYSYLDFVNYCMLDYVNCMERYDMWQLVHMGYCYTIKLPQEYDQ